MAMVPKGNSVASIGTGWTTVVPAVGVGKTQGLASCILANITGASINVTAQVVRSGGALMSHIVKNAPIPTGSALEIIINKPVVLNEGDYVRVQCSVDNAADATYSVAEQ